MEATKMTLQLTNVAKGAIQCEVTWCPLDA